MSRFLDETGLAQVAGHVNKKASIFYGTQAEWDELTTEEKKKYDYTAFPEGSEFSSLNWLKGKTVNFLGDSITQGFLDGSHVMERPYPSIVANMLECTCNNNSVAGSTLVGSGASYSYESFTTRMTSMDKTADMNVVMGGTNDYAHQVDIGKLSDTGTSTIYGALNTIAQYLISEFPNAINVFCAPLRFGTQNNTRFAMEEIVYAVKSVAKKYGFVYIDTYHNLPGWNPQIQALVTKYGAGGTDTTHPNQLFNDMCFGKYMAMSLLRLDGGIAVTPKDPPFIRPILDFSNYYEGNWFTGSLRGYVDEGILYVNFSGCTLLQAGGGAPIANISNANSTGWDIVNYCPNIPTSSGYVGEWKLLQGANDQKPCGFMFLGNGENSWRWMAMPVDTYPTGPIYADIHFPLDR